MLKILQLIKAGCIHLLQSIGYIIGYIFSTRQCVHMLKICSLFSWLYSLTPLCKTRLNCIRTFIMPCIPWHISQLSKSLHAALLAINTETPCVHAYYSAWHKFQLCYSVHNSLSKNHGKCTYELFLVLTKLPQLT